MKCVIKRNKDGKLIPYDDNYLKMSTSAPWTITYKSNEAEGYERDAVIECSNKVKSESVAHKVA